MACRGTWTGRRDGPVPALWSSARPSVRCCTRIVVIPSRSSGWVELGLRAALRRRTAWENGWMRSWTNPGHVHWRPEAPICWADPMAWAAVEGGILLLCLPLVRPHLQSCLQIWGPPSEGCGTSGVNPEDATEVLQGLEPLCSAGSLKNRRL